VKSRQRPDRERADERTDGNEGRKEAECMISKAGKRGKARKWREGSSGRARERVEERESEREKSRNCTAASSWSSHQPLPAEKLLDDRPQRPLPPPP
jgi:hypothetical protein